ncbi:MAG: hypothetical protein HFJ57_07745, partial [Clostridia bacterium]|nr:hypothetical protein [Clostridia bacterium]
MKLLRKMFLVYSAFIVILFTNIVRVNACDKMLKQNFINLQSQSKIGINAFTLSIDATGYTVEADIQSDAGISKVQLPTWTSKNGQDDIQWYTVQVDANNHIKYHVDIRNHNYEDGEYITHLYVTDQTGRRIGKAYPPVQMKKTPMTIKNAQITSIDATGYTIEADIQSDYGVNKVQLPTWTSRNGQDDIRWYTVQADANNHIKYHIDIKNHNYEDGEYITHLYVTDQAGRKAGKVFAPTQIKRTPLAIKNVQIASIDATGYTIEADIQSDYGITKVQLPTWTSKNGQDDIQWYTVPV